jgi:hypothetical protein
MFASVSVGRSTYSARVCAADGVLFSATAECASDLLRRIVEYIRARCDYVLWPADAHAVRALIDANQPGSAIALYFASVGQRWDGERLELEPAGLA